MIDFTCPNCGQELSFDDDMLGTAVLCFACDRALTVPPPGQPAEPAEPPDGPPALKSPVGRRGGLLPTVLWLIGSFVFLAGLMYAGLGLFGESKALLVVGIGTAVGSIVWFALASTVDDLRNLRYEFETFVAKQRQS